VALTLDPPDVKNARFDSHAAAPENKGSNARDEDKGALSDVLGAAAAEAMGAAAEEKEGGGDDGAEDKGGETKREGEAWDEVKGGGEGGIWVESFDDESGAPYWYNEATGETTWSDPHSTG